MLGTRIGSEREAGAMELALAFATKASAAAQASAAHAAANRRGTEVPPSSCAGLRVLRVLLVLRVLSLDRRRGYADAQPVRACQLKSGEVTPPSGHVGGARSARPRRRRRGSGRPRRCP